MSDSPGHPPHLPVFPFDQFQTYPASGNCLAKADRRIAGRQFRLRFQQPHATRQSFSSLNQDAAFQFAQAVAARNSFHLRPVNPAMPVPRVDQAFIQPGFVA